jgi:thiamine-phosphate diphosphorylase
MLVTDRSITSDRTLADAVIKAAPDCVTAVQLREKDLPAAELLRLARHLKRGLAGETLLIVNDRVDVALAAGADGVQLGTGALGIKDVRRIAPGLLIGASVHAVDEAIKAELDGASYLVVGTMFATRSHPGKKPEGLELVREIRLNTKLPLIGIGGITAENAGSVMAAGADGVAVITEILAAADPAAAARRLWRALQ